jgi:hypothetical protein
LAWRRSGDLARIEPTHEGAGILYELMVFGQELVALDALLDRERDLAAAEHVAGFERCLAGQRRAVQLGAVAAAGIGEDAQTGGQLQLCVLPRDARRDDDDVARGRAADERLPFAQDDASRNANDVGEVDGEQLSSSR